MATDRQIWGVGGKKWEGEGPRGEVLALGEVVGQRVYGKEIGRIWRVGIEGLWTGVLERSGV